MVPPEAQDVIQWDEEAIERAESALEEATRRGGTGRYGLEAAIQSAHVARRRLERDTWTVVAQLDHVLVQQTGAWGAILGYVSAFARVRGAA